MALNRDDIRELQAGLRLLGYDDVGTIDGIAGRNTRQEIAAFIEKSGTLPQGAGMETVLAAVRSAVAADPGAQEKLRALAADPRALDTDQKRMLQAGLRINGVEGTDGQELAIDGIAGRNTLGAAAHFNQNAAPGNAPLTPEQMKLLQGGLSVLGYDAGTIDGLDGPQTQKALGDFLATQNQDTTDGMTAGSLRAVQDAIKSGIAQERMAAIAADPAAAGRNAVMGLQAALTLNGEYAPMDGLVGNITRTALANAQAGYAALPAVDTANPAVTVEGADPLPAVPVGTVTVTELPPLETPAEPQILMQEAEPLAAVPTGTVTVENLPPLPAVTIPDESATGPRTIEQIETEQRALIADNPVIAPLDADRYVRELHDNPQLFDTLLQNVLAKAGEGPVHRELGEAMQKMKALEQERQTLLHGADSAPTPLQAVPVEPVKRADISPLQDSFTNAADNQALTRIEAAQDAVFSDVRFTGFEGERYVEMARSNPEMFGRLIDHLEAKPERSAFEDALHGAFTKLRDLETQRQAVLTGGASAPVVATPDANLTYNDHPFGLDGESAGALLIKSMPGYDDLPAYQAETQFVTDRLKEIYGTNGSVTLADAAFALQVYKESGDPDYNAIDRAGQELGIGRNDRLDLGDPQDLNKILTGLAAIESGGTAQIESGTRATIAQVSGFNPDTAVAITTDIQRGVSATLQQGM